ncbi:hypothetical protein IAQ61_002859 [Plenodomus lingam]|uniref:uncharacterized protein n=1 Tax=Leptosphaeria maculans TaxID=5022 RepID=UPI00331C5447|nr:hypothetical protein IAQ61_002859 [Plenodomus lingam]
MAACETFKRQIAEGQAKGCRLKDLERNSSTASKLLRVWGQEKPVLEEGICNSGTGNVDQNLRE